MRKHKHKNKNAYCCIDCENCVPIGEGDHLCEEELQMVLVDYEPSEYFNCCGGKNFIRR